MKTASKFERQRRSKIWAELQRLDAAAREEQNTSNWVDESYAKRLSRLLRDDCQTKTGLPQDLCSLMRLSTFIGSVELKGLSVMFAHVLNLTRDGRFMITMHQYSATGYYLPNSGVSSNIMISEHAMQRLFERRRTNAFIDVTHTLRELVLAVHEMEEHPSIGSEIEVVTKMGTLYLVGAKYWEDQPNVGWVVKTFIDR